MVVIVQNICAKFKWSKADGATIILREMYLERNTNSPRTATHSLELNSSCVLHQSSRPFRPHLGFGNASEEILLRESASGQSSRPYLIIIGRSIDPLGLCPTTRVQHDLKLINLLVRYHMSNRIVELTF